MAAFNSLRAALVLATLTALAVAQSPSPAPVLLGTAGTFAILTKTGISTVPASVVTGDIGVSPIAAAAMTGFDLIADTLSTFSTSAQVTGKAYAASYVSPTPSKMTTAISDMETAYNDAAGRTTPDAKKVNLNAGLISGTTFTAGVYKWGTDVMFSSDIYLSGDANSIFILQTSGNVVAGSGAKVILQADSSGGSTPLASNIVWQVAGFLDAGTTSHLEGVFLVKTKAVFKTGSSLNGRVLTQTACSLDKTVITQPSD